MSIIIVDSNGSCTISHLDIYSLQRRQMESKILSVFHPGEQLATMDIAQRVNLPYTGVRNHIARMVKNGKLKKVLKRIVNFDKAYFEVVHGGT
jgi:predicted transcriptional regulator